MTRVNRRLPAAPIGWPLLPVPEDGALRYPSLAGSVRQSLKVLLLTRPREQLLHPEFGVGLQRFVGEADGVTTRRRIRDAIAAGIERFEPRILLDRIEVEPDAAAPDRLLIEIAYRLRRSGEAATLALAMTLEA